MWSVSGARGWLSICIFQVAGCRPGKRNKHVAWAWVGSTWYANNSNLSDTSPWYITPTKVADHTNGGPSKQTEWYPLAGGSYKALAYPQVRLALPFVTTRSVPASSDRCLLIYCVIVCQYTLSELVWLDSVQRRCCQLRAFFWTFCSESSCGYVGYRYDQLSTVFCAS
ncbi:hypothetical protein V1506DRAFT_172036 [Lipomyces tetrasporus]